MSDRNRQSDTHSQLIDIEEVIARYSSLSLGTLPTIGSRASVKSPATTAGGSTIMSRPSLPMLSSSTSDPKNLNESQRNLTHSGYFDRAQLFGRSPAPEVGPSPRRPSTAIESHHGASAEQYIDLLPRSTTLERHRARPPSSLLALETAIAKLDIDQVPTPPFQTLSQKSSYFTPKSRSSKLVETPLDNSQLSFRRQPVRSLRTSGSNLLSSPPQDEWIEAGTPEAAKGGATFTLGTDDASESALDQKVEHSKLRNVSSAVAALRDQLFNVGSRAASGGARQPSWTRRIFGGQDTTSTKSSTATSMNLREDNSFDFGHGEHTASMKIVHEIADRAQSGSSSLETDEEVAPSLDVLGKDASSDSDAVLTLSELSSHLGSPLSLHLEASPSYEHSDPSESETSPRTEEMSELSFNGAEISQEYMDFTSDSEADEKSTTLSLSPEATKTLSSTPEKAVLTMMVPISTFSQAPKALHAAATTKTKLAILAPTTIYCRVPMPAVECTELLQSQSSSLQPTHRASRQQHLTFSQASAVIYECVSFAALRVTLVSAGRDLNVFELLKNMGVGLIAGLVIAVMCSFIGVDTLSTIAADVMLAFGAAFQDMYDMMIDWTGRYELQ